MENSMEDHTNNSLFSFFFSFCLVLRVFVFEYVMLTSLDLFKMQGKIDQLKLMGPVILNAILKMLDGFTGSETDALSRETKTFSFQAIGLLAQRLPQLFR
jgi:hypothetical protein